MSNLVACSDGTYREAPTTGLEWWAGAAWPDRLQAQWDSYKDPHRYWIVNHLGADVKNLLELGCGVGANLRLIRECRPEIELFGTDGAQLPLEVAMTQFQVLLLPLPRVPMGKWDVVLINYVLSYLTPEEAVATLQAVAHVAKQVMILEPSPAVGGKTGQICDGTPVDGLATCPQWVHDWPMWCREMGWEWQHVSRLKNGRLNLATVYTI